MAPILHFKFLILASVHIIDAGQAEWKQGSQVEAIEFKSRDRVGAQTKGEPWNLRGAFRFRITFKGEPTEFVERLSMAYT